jgi:outer membrane protein assembly factor BamB
VARGPGGRPVDAAVARDAAVAPSDAAAPLGAPDVPCLPAGTGPDWPLLGGDGQRSSATRSMPTLLDHAARTPRLQRRWQLPHGRRAGAPIAAAGRVYMLREDNASLGVPLGSWSLEDGSEGCDYGWVETTSTAPAQVATIGDGRLYGHGAAGVFARDPDTAELLWEQSVLRSSATLPVGTDVLLTGFGRDGEGPMVARLHGADGEVEWAVQMPHKIGSCAHVLASADPATGRVAVSMSCGDGAAGVAVLAVFELATGQLLWSHAEEFRARFPLITAPGRSRFTGLTVHAWPTGPMLFAGADGTPRVATPMPGADLVAFDLETGEPLWRAAPSAPARLPDFESAQLEYGQYALAGERVLYVVNGVPIADPGHEPATPCPSEVYGCVEGEPIGALLVAVMADDGAPSWRYELPALAGAAPVVVGDTVLVGAGDALIFLDADDGSLAARLDARDLVQDPAPPPGPADLFIGRPVVAGGGILVQTFSETLLSLGPNP